METEKRDSFITEHDKTWGMLAHLSAFVQFIIPTFGLIVGPLIIWILKKDTMPFVKKEATEALNFNISIALYALIAGSLVFIAVGVVLLPLVFVFWFICVLVASIKAYKGIHFRYPLTLRFIK